ncbi:MAG: PadR family transcriptional regulator [Tumebacillaceae bacterium]
MNTLSYGLLGLLARESCSGYDLMQRMQPFWPAKHSQIYPLLAKLESEGYLEYTVVQQKDKPDKKVYSITERGRLAVQEWMTKPVPDPVIRDEMWLKSYCISLIDPVEAIPLFEKRLAFYRGRLSRCELLLAEKQNRLGDDLQSPAQPEFGDYILLLHGISQAEANIKWCQQVIELIIKSSTRG